MRRARLLSLTALAALANCAAPIMVQYETVQKAPQAGESVVGALEPALDQTPQTANLEEAPPAPAIEEIEARARAAVEAAAAAEQAAREAERAAIRAATGGGQSSSAAKLSFNLPRTLILLASEAAIRQHGGGALSASGVAAVAVPTSAPVRKRVYTDLNSLDAILAEREDGAGDRTAAAEDPEAGNGGTGGSAEPSEAQVAALTDEGDLAEGAEGGDVEVDAPPMRSFKYVERPLPLYAMRQVGGLDPFSGDGALQVAYFDNTKIVAAIGRNVRDVAGATAPTAVPNNIAIANQSPVYFTDSPQPDGAVDPILPQVLPTAIDVRFFMDEAAEGAQWLDLPFNEGWSYRMDIYDPPADSYDRKMFFTEIAGQTVNVLPVSACRDATLYVVKDTPDNLQEKEDIGVDYSRYVNERAFYTFHMKIADPGRIQVVPLPGAGQVTMHAACGADLRVDSASSAEERAFIGRASQQARAILDSWQKLLRR